MNVSITDYLKRIYESKSATEFLGRSSKDSRTSSPGVSPQNAGRTGRGLTLLPRRCRSSGVKEWLTTLHEHTQSLDFDAGLACFCDQLRKSCLACTCNAQPCLEPSTAFLGRQLQVTASGTHARRAIVSTGLSGLAEREKAKKSGGATCRTRQWPRLAQSGTAAVVSCQWYRYVQ